MGVHWKDWCWSWNSNTLATWCEELTYLKRSWCWERLRAGEGDDRGWDAGWHHRLDGHGCGCTPGAGDGQGGLACCSSWGRKESDTAEQLNWSELKRRYVLIKIIKHFRVFYEFDDVHGYDYIISDNSR